MIAHSFSILWRRLDLPGHESARLFEQGANWNLLGTAVFAFNRLPCRLDYTIRCGADWQTLSARVAGWLGEQPVEIDIAADSSHRWRLNGVEQPQVASCVDVDLNFSPTTNLLPIRRLRLETGQSARVTAAWLRFPGFTLEPLEQVYRRTGPLAYRYESASGSFVADLKVNEAGLVVEYPGLWVAEDGA